MTLGSAGQTARSLSIGYDDNLLPGDGTLNQTSGDLTVAGDPRIGYDISGPGGGGSVGKLSFNDGTVTANSLTLGDADSDGLGNGTLDMSGGSLTVNGDASLGTGTAVSIGTVNMTGGVFKADSITKGVGTANFNFTGGTLSVDTFGFDLTQDNTDNPSFLSPGDSVGTTTIQGDYELLGGSLVIELDSFGSYDQIVVTGDVSLAGDLFFLDYDGSPHPFTITYSGGDGNDVTLGAVPEPGSLILLALGLLCLLARRRQA